MGRSRSEEPGEDGKNERKERVTASPLRRRKGSASGLTLRAPLPRRRGMRRAGKSFPNNREDETQTQGAHHGGTFHTIQLCHPGDP